MISNGNDQIELTSDVITATSDGVYTEFARYRTTQNDQVTESSRADTGSWVTDGTYVGVSDNRGTASGTGILIGTTFTLAENGLSWLYTK